MGRLIPGLTRAESNAYKSAISQPGAETPIRVKVLDLDHKPLGQLDGVLGGQVRWDRRGDFQTQGTIMVSEFGDPWDLDLRHLLRPEMGVVTETHGTLWCPLMTGWVTHPRDAGHEVEYGITDKMAMGLLSSRRGKSGRNEHVGKVIRDIFEQLGETKFNIPDHLITGGPKVGQRIQWGGGNPDRSGTRIARRLAKGHDLQVFTDQLGRVTVRRPPKEPALSWIEEPDDDDPPEARLLQPISWARDLTTIRNVVIGAGKKGLRSRAVTRDRYTYSPERLQRGKAGSKVPLLLEHRFADDSLNRQGELDDATEAMLRRLSVERADVQIASTPAPWILPHDLLHGRKSNGKATDFWMVTGSIELDGSSMAIGYQEVLDRAKVRSRALKRNRKGGRRG